MRAQIKTLSFLLSSNTRIFVTSFQINIIAIIVSLELIASKIVHTSVLTKASSYWLNEAQVNSNDNRQSNNNKNDNRDNNDDNRDDDEKIKRQKSHFFTSSIESNSFSLFEFENALFRIHSARRVHRSHNDFNFWMTTMLTITCIMKRIYFMTFDHWRLCKSLRLLLTILTSKRLNLSYLNWKSMRKRS